MILSQAQFDFICQVVRQHSGIVLGDDELFLMETQIMPVARHFGFNNVSDMISEMQGKRRLDIENEITEILIPSDTCFFRDVHPFNALKTDVIPELIRLRSTERSLAIWCGACSTGQEPWSIAMILHDQFPQLLDWNLEIIATDYSEDLLERAREGVYNQLEINRGLPVQMLTKFFTHDRIAWRLKDRLRQTVQYRQLNLLHPWHELQKMDLVFMRNVLSYFDLPTKQAILTQVRNQLKPDGYLFLGADESTTDIDTSFQSQTVGQASYYQLNRPPINADPDFIEPAEEPELRSTQPERALQ